MWNTLLFARERWVNGLSDDVMEHLLEVANSQCIAYLGVEPEDILARHLEAELQQARNIYNASKADPAQADDGTTFIIRPYPLDQTIKNLLLPVQAIPGMW